MQTRKIQVKHPHGPIMIIIEYLPEQEQLKMQGINKDFYDKIIPVVMRKISIPRTYLFANYEVGTGIKLQYVTKRGQMLKVQARVLP